MTQANHYPNRKMRERKKNNLPILDYPILLEALIPSSLHRNTNDKVHRASVLTAPENSRRKKHICPAAKRFPVIFRKGKGTCTLLNAKKKKLLLWPNLADLSAGNEMQNTTVDWSGMFGNINCEKIWTWGATSYRRPLASLSSAIFRAKV